MTKNEKVKKAIEVIVEYFKDSNQKDREILVPEGIEFTKIGFGNYSLGLSFGDKQELIFDYSMKIWLVCGREKSIKTKLVKCKREDVEVGKWYFCCPALPDHTEDKKRYKLFIDKENYVFINDLGMPEKDSFDWNYCYRVEEA